MSDARALRRAEKPGFRGAVGPEILWLLNVTMSYIVPSLTFRTTASVLTQLEARARLLRVPKTVLAERYVEEGLTQEAFPGVVFRDGPAGRRAGLLGGPDIWEVIEVFMAEGRNAEGTAQRLGLRLGLVDSAVRYYAADPAAVDEWIDRNRRLMREAEEQVARQRRILGG
jgi:hypothetical protein